MLRPQPVAISRSTRFEVLDPTVTSVQSNSPRSRVRPNLEIVMPMRRLPPRWHKTIRARPWEGSP